MMDNSKGAVGALKKHSVIHNSVPCDLFSLNVKQIKKNSGLRKGFLVENGFCRNFRKANRHKKDYVMLDFENNNQSKRDEDYMKMESSSNKWHFIDFTKKSK